MIGGSFALQKWLGLYYVVAVVVVVRKVWCGTNFLRVYFGRFLRSRKRSYLKNLLHCTVEIIYKHHLFYVILKSFWYVPIYLKRLFR